MAFPAAYFGLFYILVGFAAIGSDLNLLREKEEGPPEFRTELQMLTGICPEDTRHRTVPA